MTPRASVVLVVTSLVFARVTVVIGQLPARLGPADLRVSGIAVDDDSASVRRRLGAPVSVDSSVWQYHDLQIFFKGGKVAILSLTGRSRATRRGLRVGDPRTRASALYRPCYVDSLLVQICYNPNDFDERAVTASLSRGRIERINVGRIIEP